MDETEKARLALAICNFLSLHARERVAFGLPTLAGIVQALSGASDDADEKAEACVAELERRGLAREWKPFGFLATQERPHSASTSPDPWAWVEG
jgi:hypothetical protein